MRTIFLLMLVLMGWQPAMARHADPPEHAGSTANKSGVHLLLDDGRQQWPVERWEEHIRLARQAAGEWGFVTQLVRLDDLDVRHWQRFMDLCAVYHLRPILRLATTYDREAGAWRAPVRDGDGSYKRVAAAYAGFIVGLRWPAEEHYIIVGNEPNRGDEWGGSPDPAAYARFFVDVASTLKEHDPHAMVLNAGLDLFAPHSGSGPAFDGKSYMDAETFLDQMHLTDPKVWSHIDVWASHSYPLGPFSEGPWRQEFAIDLLGDASNPRHIQPPATISNRGINGYEWELFKLATFGVSRLPVMITETGWRHAESVDPAALDSGARLPEARTVAIFLDLALCGNHGRYPWLPERGWQPWLSDARVVGVTFFAFNGHPAEWGHTNWLILDNGGRVKGTYVHFGVLPGGNAQLSRQPGSKPGRVNVPSLPKDR